MPRGRKKQTSMSYDQLIAEIDEQIARTEDHLKDLKARKKDLAAQKEKADLALLAAAIKESGKTIDDAIQAIKGEN